MKTPLCPSPELSEHPQLRRWLCRLRRLGLFLAGALVLVALAFGFENVRGWRELKAEMDRLQASGRGVQLEDIIPPAIPDERNVAMIPSLRPLLDLNPDRHATNRWRDPAGYHRAQEILLFQKIHGSSKPPRVAEVARGQPIDLAAWQTYFRAPVQSRTSLSEEVRKRYGLLPIGGPVEGETNGPPGYPLPPIPGTPAEDVLRALAVFEPDFAALHEGLQRPDCRYPLAYEDGYSTLLPHLAVLKRLTTAFSLRSAARLEAGDVAGAYSDLEDALKLGETLRTEPFFISQLVRQACDIIALGALWEGQRRHAWTEPQWAVLQSRLTAVDLREGFRRAIHAERVGTFRAVRQMGDSLAARREFADMASTLFGPDGQPYNRPWLVPYLLLAPRGWLFASAAATSRALEQLETVDPRSIPDIRGTWADRNDASSARLLLHHHFIRSGFITGFGPSTVRSHQNDFQVRLAVIACALERFRLARGAYPEAWTALVPALLPSVPIDPVTGQPLAYRREAGDGFRVWSVGENGKDDGGVWPERGGTEAEVARGDWVWGWPDAPGSGPADGRGSRIGGVEE